jgi:hypothetical protein
MDLFVPSAYTKQPTEQSPLASPRNPHSSAHLWRRQLPLHQQGKQHQTNLGQLTARMARLDKGSPGSTKTMFPFRIFTLPGKFQAVPNWTDAFGAAQWRSFCVYTGTACAWKAVEGYDPSGSTPWLFSPQPACVAYTAGWNNLLPPQIVNENYNEMYSTINLGNYLDAPENSNGDFDPAYTEIVFTSPPNSIAVFWISWDTLEDDGGDVNYWQVAALNDNYYGTFPVLHFGGYTLATTPGGSPGYFGDLNADNAAILAGPGDQIYGGVDNGTPPQYIAFAQQIGSSTYSSDMDEGAVLVGSMVIGQTGSDGASTDNPTPSNDGYCQIYQQLFDNMQGQQPRRRVWQGPYDADSIYYPGEIVTESAGEYINATEYAMVGYDPVSNASGSPLTDGVEYATLKNFWMPVGGGGGSSDTQYIVLGLGDNYLYAGGTIANIFLVGPGTGYTSAPTISFTPAPPTGGTNATATATINVTSGTITSLVINNSGFGYNSAPTIVFTGGGGSMASASCNVSNVNCALPPLLQRQSYDGQNINCVDGQHSYSYISPGKRTDTLNSSLGTNTYNSVIWPPYLATTGNTPIVWKTVTVYKPTNNTRVSGLNYQVRDDHRGWEVQAQYCDNGVSANVFVPSPPTGSAV